MKQLNHSNPWGQLLAKLAEGWKALCNWVAKGVAKVIKLIHDIGKAFKEAAIKIHKRIQAATVTLRRFVDENKEEIVQFFEAVKDPNFKEEWPDLWLVKYAERAFEKGDLMSVDEVIDFLYINRQFIRRTLGKKSMDIRHIDLKYQIRLALFEVLKGPIRYCWGFSRKYGKRIRDDLSEKTRNRAIELAVEEYVIEHPHMENTVKRRKMQISYIDNESLSVHDCFDSSSEMEEKMQIHEYKESLKTMLNNGELSQEQTVFVQYAVEGTLQTPVEVIRSKSGLKYSHWQSLVRKVNRRYG